MKKYKKDGKVAILVSPGYGAGWSTWGDNEEFLAMDKGLVEMKLRNAPKEEVEEYIRNTIGEEMCMGGWKKAIVSWLNSGTSFVIDEYDGYESLATQDSLVMTA